MKTLKYLIAVFAIAIFASCENDDSNSEKVQFAVPTIKSLTKIRSNVSITGAKTTSSDGKIYVSENYLFYIAQEEGVHIYNNQNPAAPVNTAFINLEGVHDIAVKGNYLYADNFVDLLVFDISNINNITLVQTVENSISFSPTYPTQAAFYDYTVYPVEGEIITGFKLQLKNKPNDSEVIFANDALAGFESSAANTVGTGGSYAKFQINNNALYTVDSYQLNVFNITDPENTFFDKSVSMTIWINGGIFETLFIQKETLFVGATTGMYTVDASDEFNPNFVGGFSHATACDPVVVFGNTAYITVRGGSSCGAIEDQVNVIDVTDIANPSLLSTTLLSQPYGLGIRNGVLYVCCGTNGLKVFNAANSANLTLENTYNENVKDVIPLDSHLIVVGKNKIIQYNYGVNFTLIPISEISF